MNKKIPYTLIDTAGQITAVIDVPVSRAQQPEVAKPLMAKIKNIGQVCFIEKDNSTPRLQMMGNELSVNGIVAGSFYLLQILKKIKITLKTSGLNETFLAQKNNGSVSIYFPKSLIKSINKNTVILAGIKYFLQSGSVPENLLNDQKNKLIKLCRNYPASGIIFYDNNKIQPLIYVKSTKTFVWETSCGSGSIAFAKVTGFKNIIQPSGKKTLVRFNKETIVYETEVKYEL